MNKAQHTRLVGLIGRGIGASRSPQMHETEAAALGVPLVYRLIDFNHLGYDNERLDGLVRTLQGIGFDGFNVTHPFKQQILASLDSISPDAAAVGAVNTVVIRDGERRGFNTDWSGFRSSLMLGFPNSPMGAVAQIGCGGAGSAVAYALLSMGISHLRVHDPDTQKAQAMAARIESHFPGKKIAVAASAGAALEGADGIVQTSPIGMAAHPGMPFAAELLRPDMWVCDIVYFPIETELLRSARALGCSTLSGGGMAVHQAADAFRLITGIEPSLSRMLDAFNQLSGTAA